MLDFDIKQEVTHQCKNIDKRLFAMGSRGEGHEKRVHGFDKRIRDHQLATSNILEGQKKHNARIWKSNVVLSWATMSIKGASKF